MSKQLQDAYIVAATRTPIGKAPRGFFKNTRPDDLLVRAIQCAMSRVPSLDPKLINDAIIGCSFPEAEQGFNMARIVGDPGRPAEYRRRRHRQPLLRIGHDGDAMAADRIRVGEADVMIAGGVESMWMVPMMGNHPSMNTSVFAATRTSAWPTAWA